MKTLYIECKMGAAGDMLQGALYELLSDEQKVTYLSTMNRIFGDDVSIEAIPGSKCGICGTKMKVTVLGTEEGHDHEHSHEHSHDHHHHDHHHEDTPLATVHTHDAGDHRYDDLTYENGLTHEEMHLLGIPHSHEETAEHNHGHHHDHEHCHDHEHHHDHEHCHDHEHHHDHEHEHCHDHEHHHDHNHGHAHSHSHSHYSYASICHQIEHLDLPQDVREHAAAVYRLIGDAEAFCHGSTLENIHFHEVGSLDALADVTGVALLLSMIAPEQIMVSPIHVGNGTVRCAHGILPVPAPATAEILKGVPYYTGEINTELCTPTGAAILKHYASSFCSMPIMNVRASGFGLGTKDFPIANGVRVFLGDQQLPEMKAELPEVYYRQPLAEKEYSLGAGTDQILAISCNIDDMTGEELGFAMELLLDAGALDVFYENIHMKKNRPAVLLNCFCHPSDKDRFALMILKYTSTRGVRFQLYNRAKLSSRFETVSTGYGDVRKKISSGYGIEKSKYEYDDLRAIALKEGLSLAEVLQLLS